MPMREVAVVVREVPARLITPEVKVVEEEMREVSPEAEGRDTPAQEISAKKIRWAGRVEMAAKDVLPGQERWVGSGPPMEHAEKRAYTDAPHQYQLPNRPPLHNRR